MAMPNNYTIILIVWFITEILSSGSLKDLFYIILVIGNMINAVSYNIHLMLYCCGDRVQGSRSGCAYGFTVNSLDNLKDTRANKPQMTFMHYVVSVSSVLTIVLMYILRSYIVFKPELIRLKFFLAKFLLLFMLSKTT